MTNSLSFELKNDYRYLLDWFKIGLREGVEGSPPSGPTKDIWMKEAYSNGYNLGQDWYAAKMKV